MNATSRLKFGKQHDTLMFILFMDIVILSEESAAYRNYNYNIGNINDVSLLFKNKP